MQVEAKDRLKWAREILLSAREKLAVERDRATHGRVVDIIQIITMVDAAALVCKEITEGE
ncbi:MAG: hypothetical protein EB119_01695 [Synechococcaceae bacterium WBB_34_004]|nr:hypothetical protein [Synechococcaceae bacterium WBB_34_004]